MWYYTSALRNIVLVTGDFLWFWYHFFSLPVLTRTIFAPWRRLDENYAGGFNPSAALATLIVNTLMRLVGVIIRLLTILVGIIFLLVTLALMAAFFCLWFILPLLAPALFISGWYLILHS